MADLTEMVLGNAVATGEWSRNGRKSRWAAWAKDPSAGIRNATFWNHGGAQNNWEDIEIPSNDTMLMLANELNTIVISYDTSPGYFRLGTGEGSDSRDVFHTQYEHMAAISRLRTLLSNATGENPLPSGMTLTTDPDFSVHGGSSSGGYNCLRTQLMPSGSSRHWLRPQVGRNSYDRLFGHECNILFPNIPQTTLSQFCETVTNDSGDTTYVTNGVHLTGDSVINVTGDTIELLRANRISITVGATTKKFAIAADSGSSPSTITITPPLDFDVPDSTPIVLQHDYESYGARSWASPYLFSYYSDLVWRSDDASGRGYPLKFKRRADIDTLLRADNPRVHEISMMLTGNSGTSIGTSSLTGDRSFLSWYTSGEINPKHIDLHDEMQSMWLAHYLYFTLGNTNVEAFVGSTSTNVNYGDVSVPWNKGRYISYSPADFKTFLQARGW